MGAIALVAYLGEIAFEHAQQTEKSKRNGEALVAWLGKASAERFNPDYPVKACAGGGENMKNPFKGKAPEFIDQCNPADKSLTGEIVLLKNTPTPPGSAVPSISSKLAAEDSIDQKLQLSIGICDKGSYLVKVSDVEF